MKDRSSRIFKLLQNQKFRAAYIQAKLGVLVPSQIRSLRLKSSNPPMPRQQDLAEETGMQQSRISMFETPGAANVTLETLANIAAGLRVGLIVKFVPFSEMLRWENSYAPDTFDVIPRLEKDEAFLFPDRVLSANDAIGGAPVAVNVAVTATHGRMPLYSNELADSRKPPQAADQIHGMAEAAGGVK